MKKTQDTYFAVKSKEDSDVEAIESATYLTLQDAKENSSEEGDEILEVVVVARYKKGWEKEARKNTK